jgi:hypothetical protein
MSSQADTPIADHPRAEALRADDRSADDLWLKKKKLQLREEELRRARQGGIAAYIVAAVALSMIVFAATKKATGGVLGFYNDPSILSDVTVFALGGYFLSRGSRAAGILVTTYFFVSVGLVSAVSYGLLDPAILDGMVPPRSRIRLLLYVVAAFFLVRGTWSAFVYQNLLAREETLNWRRRWGWLAGMPAVIVVLGFFGAGIWALQNEKTLSRVTPAADMPKGHQQFLLDNGVVEPNETIVYFFSAQPQTPQQEGAVLTDRTINAYWLDDEGKVESVYLPLEEISDISLFPGGAPELPLYKITGKTRNEWMVVALGRVEGDDRMFLDEVWRRAREMARLVKAVATKSDSESAPTARQPVSP